MLENNCLVRLNECFVLCMTDKPLNQFSWLPPSVCIQGLRLYLWVCLFVFNSDAESFVKLGFSFLA